MKNNDPIEALAVPPPMLFGYAETYVKLAQARTIFLSETITKDVAAALSAFLLYYDNLNSEEEITLYLNSDGGEVSGLINIYDVMQMICSPVKTICVGKCYSAAAILLAAGEPGSRFAFKNSQLMIHGIQCAFPIAGHDQISSKNYYEFLKDNNDNIMKILANHTGHPLEKIKEDCKTDVFFTAKQALDYGLIDAIIE